jgi:hypothetical protein
MDQLKINLFVRYRNLIKSNNAEDESPESNPIHIPVAASSVWIPR